eukprot:3458904-Karenia_brevis.AAC.1
MSGLAFLQLPLALLAASLILPRAGFVKKAACSTELRASDTPGATMTGGRALPATFDVDGKGPVPTRLGLG